MACAEAALLRGHTFDKETIGKMSEESFLVNNARGAICDTQAIVDALKSGQLRCMSIAPCLCSATVCCRHAAPACRPPWRSRAARSGLCGLGGWRAFTGAHAVGPREPTLCSDTGHTFTGFFIFTRVRSAC